MRLPTPDPGTHWEFERGARIYTGLNNPTGCIPRFNLIDSATGETIDSVYPDAYPFCAKFFTRWAAQRVILDHRESKRAEVEFAELEAQYPPGGRRDPTE